MCINDTHHEILPLLNLFAFPIFNYPRWEENRNITICNWPWCWIIWRTCSWEDECVWSSGVGAKRGNSRDFGRGFRRTFVDDCIFTIIAIPLLSSFLSAVAVVIQTYAKGWRRSRSVVSLFTSLWPLWLLATAVIWIFPYINGSYKLTTGTASLMQP